MNILTVFSAVPTKNNTNGAVVMAAPFFVGGVYG